MKKKIKEKPLYFSFSLYWLEKYVLRKIGKAKDQTTMA